MKRYARSKLTAAVLGFALMAPLAGLAQQPTAPQDGGEPGFLTMTGDLVVARPLGVVTSVGGLAVFLVSLPFTALGGNTDEAAETLVAGPLRETFARCLGCRSSKAKSYN